MDALSSYVHGGFVPSPASSTSTGNSAPSPALVGGEAAYGVEGVSGFQFGLKEGGGLVVWEGELSAEDRQWAEVPPMPEAEVALRTAFAECMAQAPPGAVARRGRGVGIPLVDVKPSGYARVDAAVPGQTKRAFRTRLSRGVCDALIGLWKTPLPPANLPRVRAAKFKISAGISEGAGLTSAFAWESQLEDYLVRHWHSIDALSDSLELVGSQITTSDRGRIDVLCKNNDGSGFTVIELKRGLSGDATLGQVQRYMGWVRQHRARGNQSVWGIIICHDADPRLITAVSVAANVDVYTYDARGDQFVLSKQPKTTN